jgi:hypothetical protein
VKKKDTYLEIARGNEKGFPQLEWNMKKGSKRSPSLRETQKEEEQ